MDPRRIRSSMIAGKMVDQTEQQRGTVPLTAFLNDFRSATSDRELREKYGLSARSFVSLIKALLERGVIGHADLALRREMQAQRDMAKEHEFLAALFVCPNCSHPSPKAFAACPACGAEITPAHGVPVGGSRRSEEEIEVVELVEEEDSVEEEPTGDKPSGLGTVRSLLSKLKKK